MKISNREWVQLSSYLDGELNPKEKNLLEKRILQNPQLQSALKELQTAKKVLKHTPQISVPRNFTLIPAMVGIKTRRPAGRGYRLAAVALSFLFIGVVVLDFGSLLLLGGSFAPTAPKEMILEAVSESAADSMEEPSLMAAGEEAEAERAAVEVETDLSQEEGAPAVAAEAVEEAEAVGMAEAEEKSADEVLSEPATNQADSDGEGFAEDQVLPTQTSTMADDGSLPTEAQKTTADEVLSTQTPAPQPTGQVY
ncbi:MAG: hypothetical protein HQ574_03990, partial [Chloroflexi bacterium]|nr:hypothetical protein [Chloroflexota bacterium]